MKFLGRVQKIDMKSAVILATLLNQIKQEDEEEELMAMVYDLAEKRERWMISVCCDPQCPELQCNDFVDLIACDEDLPKPAAGV